MNDATKAKFAAILAEAERKAAEATAKKTGQPQAPKQATPPPQPQPAPVVVAKSTLQSFSIIWHEGTGEFDGQTFNTWYAANKAMTEICRNHGYNQGYSKVKICVKWENGEEMTDRADCGKHSSGDFDSDFQTIGQYLEKSRSVMYARTFSSRENLSFEDSPETIKAAIIAEQTAAAEKDRASEQAAAEQVQDETTAPELSTMTSADLLNDTTPAAYAVPQFCAPVAMPRFNLTKSAPPAVEVKKAVYKIVNYSEKAFAVYAENNDAIALRKIQENMYRLGGKFNPRLKDGAGYIFSKRNLNAVTAHFAAK